MTKQRLAHSIAALGFGLTLVATPALAASTPVSEPAAAVAPTHVVAADSPAATRAQRYAAREAASPRAADFKGNGAGIYIGGSTLAVVLVVVLILVLL